MDSYLRFQRKRKRKIISALFGILMVVLLFGILVFILTVASLVNFVALPSVFSLLAVILSVGFTTVIVYGIYRTLRDINTYHVAAYYNKRIGDKNINTWLNGEEIYKRMQEIDEICVIKGVTKLTEFGFYDDKDGEEVIWHNPSQGLLTLTAIKKHLTANKISHEKLLTEIARLEYALSKAAEKDIQFSLLLWPVNSSTNAMEWENRKGTCW
jgi:hypothetical protein